VRELPAGSGGYAPVARFAAALLTGVHAGKPADPAVTAAFDAISGASRRTWTVWQLATARLDSNRLADVEALTCFGLEHEAEPTLAPRLWHVRSEAAQRRGDWEFAGQCLDLLEQSIAPDETYADHPQAERLVRQNHEYRSRLLQGRAHVLLELGLLDLARAPTLAALEEARASGDASALAAARLLACERALAKGGDEEEAVGIARAGWGDPLLAPWHALFYFYEGMAEIERAHDALPAVEPARAAARQAHAAFTGARGAGLPPSEALKMELGLGELDRMLGCGGAASARLERARALAGGLGGSTSESIQLAMLAWRLAHEGLTDAAELEPARAGLLEAYPRFLEEWSSTPRRPGGVGFLHVAWRAQLVSEVIEAELSTGPAEEGEERAFARVLQMQALGTRTRAGGPRDFGVAELRSELLGEKRGMLLLLPARDRSHLFVLDAKGVDHYRLPLGREPLRDRARPITASLQDRDRPVDKKALGELHDALLPAAVRARMSTWSGAFTTGFDLLCDLPFGILGGESGAPYARRLALASLPSAAFGLELVRRARPLPTGKELVLVVASDPPEGFGPQFRFTEGEQRRLFEGFQSTALIERPSRGGLLEQRSLLGGARILHFLAHGTELPGGEYWAALVLSGTAKEGQRFFAAEDVAQLELGGLVILSACGSGLGPPRVGDDRLVHLGGAFLDAGARCVMLTPFPVEYETTLALMERVHAFLAEGRSPAEALRAARAASGGELEAYHAASFEVLGLGFEPVLRR
jgi:CHAT domain-containing protein